ncbi:MAG: NAD-dependent epimerase/dehydratase family protein [Verrucomicrobiales bacterium]
MNFGSAFPRVAGILIAFTPTSPLQPFSALSEQNTRPPKSLAELDERITEPSPGVVETLRGIDGDIMVAGAGGKMGFHLCVMLRRGIDSLGKTSRVVAVSRFGDAATREAFADRSIETIPADLTAPAAVRKLPEASALFFLAGKKFGTSDSPETLRVFNEEMPALVAERFASIPIVAFSTGCVYPFTTPASGGSKETDPVGPVGAYAVSCLGRETAFIESSRSNGTPLALIRLNYSVDLRYGVLVDLAVKVLAGEPVDLEMGFLNCIWQGDALDHSVRSLDHAAVAPDHCVMNVTGPRVLSIRQTAERFAEHFGKKVSFRGEEAETAWLSDAEKSHRLFGPPRVSEERLVEWVADWVGQGRPLLGKPTHFEVRDGNY